MSSVKVIAAERLARPGTLTQVSVDLGSGRDLLAVAVCNVDGEVHALVGVCPHAGGPLGQGALHGHTIICPWHAWEFDCRTGECDFNDSRVAVLPVRIAGGWIEVERA